MVKCEMYGCRWSGECYRFDKKMLCTKHYERALARQMATVQKAIAEEKMAEESAKLAPDVSEDDRGTVGVEDASIVDDWVRMRRARLASDSADVMRMLYAHWEGGDE